MDLKLTKREGKPNLNPENKILNALKERNLTNKEIAKLTKLKINKVRKHTLELRKLDKINIESKKGRENIYSSNQLYIESLTEDKYFNDLLFTFISTSGIVNYEQLVNFYSTLGVREDDVLFRILYNLQKGEIEVVNLPKGVYSQFLLFLIKNLKNLKGVYPLTMSFLEAYIFFRPLGFSNIEELIARLKNISKDYPEFFSINSSEKGEPEDSIIFNKIFIRQINFMISEEWRIS
jgi:DNA-binding CsgD family transcriptional regulator